MSQWLQQPQQLSDPWQFRGLYAEAAYSDMEQCFVPSREEEQTARDGEGHVEATEGQAASHDEHPRARGAAAQRP